MTHPHLPDDLKSLLDRHVARSEELLPKLIARYSDASLPPAERDFYNQVMSVMSSLSADVTCMIDLHEILANQIDKDKAIYAASS